MQVPKELIVQFLRDRGKDDLAEQAAQHLPEQVDVQKYAETLKRYGIDLPVLIAKLPEPLRRLLG